MKKSDLRDEADRRRRGCSTMTDEELRRLANSVARKWADDVDAEHHTITQATLPTKEQWQH